MQATVSLTADYSRTLDGFRDSIARNDFRLAASMDPHIRQFLKVMVQEPQAAIPIARPRGSSLRGAGVQDHGILCLTRDFFVYAEGHRVLRYNNDYELFDRSRVPFIGILGADRHGMALRQMGYRPAYSYFYGEEKDINRFVSAAARL